MARIEYVCRTQWKRQYYSYEEHSLYEQILIVCHWREILGQRQITKESVARAWSHANVTDPNHKFFCAQKSGIRLTTLDAGQQAQVFTSLWYPRDSLLPVLGVDLLQFGQKTLCIVDFQPITNDQPEQQAAIEKEMAKIRCKYPSLQSQMTNRFYSASDTFFSKQMLLGRHDASVKEYTAEELVQRDLFPAFQQYVRLHTQTQKLVTQAEVCSHDLHASYDTYSAVRDPAHHLLAKIFGQEWADEYVFDILFPSAQKA